MSEASPIDGVTIPDGYRGWELIAPAQEGEPLDELRAVVGNRTAIVSLRFHMLLPEHAGLERFGAFSAWWEAFPPCGGPTHGCARRATAWPLPRA
jgi:hypothetical protein